MKKYPFSVQKHAHSIEMYYNHVKNTMAGMECSDIDMDSARYNRLADFMENELEPLYIAMFDSRDGRVVYLSGRQIGIAKKIVAWASERRAKSLIDAGKFEHLKYC